MGMRSVVFAGAVVLAGPAVAGEFSNMTGGYFGALGGYQFDPQKRNDPDPFSSDPIAPPSRGGVLGAFVGYNRLLGETFIGMEARGGYNFAAQGIARNDPGSQTSFPFQTGSFDCFCDVRNFPIFPVYTIGDAFTSGFSATAVRRTKAGGNGDLSTRIGIFDIAGWATYARLGVGAQAFNATSTTASVTTTCHSPKYSRTITGYSTANEFVTGCGSMSTSVNVSSSSKSIISPYLTVGLGAERGFGPMFGRAEIELVDYLGSSRGSVLAFNQFYEVKATAGIGYRFR